MQEHFWKPKIQRFQIFTWIMYFLLWDVYSFLALILILLSQLLLNFLSFNPLSGLRTYLLLLFLLMIFTVSTQVQKFCLFFSLSTWKSQKVLSSNCLPLICSRMQSRSKQFERFLIALPVKAPCTLYRSINHKANGTRPYFYVAFPSSGPLKYNNGFCHFKLI